MNFSLLHVVHAGCRAHLASYPMGTGGSFPGGGGVEQQGFEAVHTPPTSAEVKNTYIYTTISPYAFMA
jgi:hypothetical protein